MVGIMATDYFESPRARAVQRARLFAVGLIVALDLFLLPRVLQLPDLAKPAGNITAGLEAWKQGLIQRPFAGPGALRDERLRGNWLWLQVGVGTLLLSLFWQPERRRRRGPAADAFGGPAPAGIGQHGTARWRTERELAETATVWRPPARLETGGFVLGARYGHRFTAWLDAADGHLLVLGATRSGKSRRVILPTIWTLAHAGESMIITDPKGELHSHSAAWLREQGYRVVLLDFREPGRGNRWNPLQAVAVARDADDFTAAGQAAWDLGHVLAFAGGVARDPYWQQQAESLIAALALAVAGHAPAAEERHMYSAYRLLIDRPPDALDKFFFILRRLDDPAWPAYGPVALTTGNTRSGVVSTATSQMRLWADPAVAWLTAQQDHDLDAPGRERTAVFLVVADERKTRYPLVTLYLSQVHQSLTALAGMSARGRLPVRVNFLLDELGNLPPIPDLDTRVTVAGGRNMRFLLAVQDLAQLRKHYRESAATITGNCATWLYLSTSDVETARVVSARTGQYTVQTEGHSSQFRQRGGDFSATDSDSLSGRALLLPDEVLRWPAGQALVLQAREQPAKLPLPDLSAWPAARDLAPAAVAAGPGRTVEEPAAWVPGGAFLAAAASERVERERGGEDGEAERLEVEQDDLDLI